MIGRLLLSLAYLSRFESGTEFPIATFWDDPFLEVFPRAIFREDDGVTSSAHETPLYTLPLVSHDFGSSDDSSVYEVLDEGSGWDVKYTRYCERSPHSAYPVDREVAVLKLIEEHSLGIAPKLLHASDPYSLPSESSASSGKLSGNRECICDGPVLVRYIVIEHMWASLRDIYQSTGLRAMKHAAALGIQMVRLLKKLHGLNVTHGSVHWGNFAVNPTQPHNLMLIGFEMSRNMADDNYAHPGIEYACRHDYYSMWEAMEDSIPSFRDDIYRVITTMAFLLHAPYLNEALHKICMASTERFQNLLREESFFDIVISLDDGIPSIYEFRLEDATSRAKLPLTHVLLQELLATVKAPTNPQDKPDYTQIEQILTSLVLINRETPQEEWLVNDDPASFVFDD